MVRITQDPDAEKSEMSKLVQDMDMDLKRGVTIKTTELDIPLKNQLMADEDDFCGTTKPAPKKDSKSFKLYECLVYFVFLAIFMSMSFLGRTKSSQNYWISTQTRNLLWLEDGDLVTTPDIYSYVYETVLPTLLPETDALGNELPDIEKHFVNGNAKLMGGIRFQTRRVKSVKCNIPRGKALFDRCYPDYSWSSRDVKDFQVNATWAIKWTSVEESKGGTWIGRLNRYDGSGYIVDLPTNQAEAKAIVEQLEEAMFIDRQTRAVFIDFNLYHPVYNLDTIGRVALELPAAGGIHPKLEVKTWQLDKYFGPNGDRYMVLEMAFWIGVCWYTFEEIFQLVTSTCSMCSCFKDKIFESYDGLGDYFSDTTNILDLSNVIFFVLSFAFKQYGRQYERENINYSDMETKYVSLRWVQRINSVESYMTAFNGMLLCVKIFKYLNWNEKFRFLFKILRSASTDLFVFLLVLFVIMLSFGMFGYLSFASDCRDYRTLVYGLGNLFRYIVTDMDYEELNASNTFVGNLFYILWNIMMIVILVNVLIAILCDAYAEVTEEAALHANTGSMTMRGFLTGIQNRMKSIFSWGMKETDRNNDGRITKRELALRLNVDTNAAQKVMDKYDPDKNGYLEEEQFVRMMETIDRDGNGNIAFDEVESAIARSQTYVSPTGPLFKGKSSRNLFSKTSNNTNNIMSRLDRLEELLVKVIEAQSNLPPLIRVTSNLPNSSLEITKTKTKAVLGEASS